MDNNWKDIKIKVVNGDYVTYSSTVDGIGFRDVLWVQGCTHNCPGCHNPETHNIERGQEVTLGEVYDKLTKYNKSNITFSGGDPVMQSKELGILAEVIKLNTNKTIWMYTGYTIERIKERVKYNIENISRLIDNIDVIVDGPFVESLKDESLEFRGSRNQHIYNIH